MGRSALTSNTSLMTAAASYAQLMAARDTFGHTGPDGSTPQLRVTAAGYRGSFKGEALAAGQSTAAAAVEAWRMSPSHAAIVFDATAVEVGIGYYYEAGDAYGSYWVLVTGAP